MLVHYTHFKIFWLLSASKPKCNFGHWSKMTLKSSSYLLTKFSRVPLTIVLISKISTMANGTLLNFGKRYEDNFKGHFWSVAKVALRYGCAKQFKNLERYLIYILHIVLHTSTVLGHDKDRLASVPYNVRFSSDKSFLRSHFASRYGTRLCNYHHSATCKIRDRAYDSL